MTYQDRLKLHLAAYKRDSLRVPEPGLYNHNGTIYERDHILPLDQADLNLLPLTKKLEMSFREANPAVSRHMYFHHLNSSQAFAFNLFIPHFADQQSAAAAALLRAFGQTAGLVGYQLEDVPDKVEGTNIDARWVTDDGVTTICEVKLSESEFGTADDDARHREKFTTIFQPRLRGHVSDKLLELPVFFKAYQFLRNVWHLIGLQNGRLVFLLPRANDRLWDSLCQLLTEVSPELRHRISVVAIEEVFATLSSDANCPAPLRVHADQMIKKYLPA